MPVGLNNKQVTLLTALKNGVLDPKILKKVTGYGHSTIYKHIESFKETGHLDIKGRRTSRPNKLGLAHTTQLVAWALSDPACTLKDLVGRLLAENDLKVTQDAVMRALRAAGLTKRTVILDEAVDEKGDVKPITTDPTVSGTVLAVVKKEAE